MKSLNLFFVLILYMGNAKPSHTIEKEKKPISNTEPYKLNLDVENLDNNKYVLKVTMEIEKGAYFVSPFSKGDYKGRFTILLDDNAIIRIEDKVSEIPKCTEGIDPFRNEPVSFVKENTIYKQPFIVTKSGDFDISGVIQFVIEPQCTMEKIGFTISSRSGKIQVKKQEY